MLTIRNLQVEYKKQSLILKGITLSMESGKIHGIVGLNGAGKTTLLNTLYGFIRPVKGSILYNDNPLHRRDIAYLESAHILTLILQQLREKGKTVLVTSHVFETLTSGCDYIHHINNGMIEQSYSKEQFGMLKELLFSTIEKQTSEQIKELIR